MRKLTEQDYWNSAYAKSAVAEPAAGSVSTPHPGSSWKKRLLVALVGQRAYAGMQRHYSDYLLWDVFFERYLPKQAGQRVIEIGSAPGKFLVEFAKRFGFIPYGVEYTEQGARINREVFLDNGFDPENVLQADFFSDDFLAAHRGRYDIVVSRGFIEHFEDAKGVVRRHVELLKPGGQLIVNIPNFSGLNYLLLRGLYQDLIPMHNLAIMRKGAFCDLFDDPRLAAQYCNYYGTLNFGIVGTNGGPIKKTFVRLLRESQLLVNGALRLALADRGCESRIWSPYLIYFGHRKTAPY